MLVHSFFSVLVDEHRTMGMTVIRNCFVRGWPAHQVSEVWTKKGRRTSCAIWSWPWGNHMSSRCRGLIIFMLELNLKWRLPPPPLSDSPRLASSGVWVNTVSHCGPLAGMTAKPKLAHARAPDSTWENPSDAHYPTCGEEKLSESAALDTCWGKQLVIKM